MWVPIFQRKQNAMQYWLPEKFRFEILEYHLLNFMCHTETLE